MKVFIEKRRIARQGGGLYVGLRLSLPVTIADLPETVRYVTAGTPYMVYQQVVLSVGLLFWQVTVYINYNAEMRS